MQFSAEVCGEKERERACRLLPLLQTWGVRVCAVGLIAPPFPCIRLSPRLRTP